MKVTDASMVPPRNFMCVTRPVVEDDAKPIPQQVMEARADLERDLSNAMVNMMPQEDCPCWGDSRCQALDCSFKLARKMDASAKAASDDFGKHGLSSTTLKEAASVGTRSIREPGFNDGINRSTHSAFGAYYTGEKPKMSTPTEEGRSIDECRAETMRPGHAAINLARDAICDDHDPHPIVFNEGSEACRQHHNILTLLRQLEQGLAELDHKTRNMRDKSRCGKRSDVSATPPSSTPIGGALGAIGLRIEALDQLVSDIIVQLEV